MRVESIKIHIDNDSRGEKFACVEVNDGFWFNNKSKLSKDFNDRYKIYPKIDKDGVMRDLIYRYSQCASLISDGKIEFDI